MKNNDYSFKNINEEQPRDLNELEREIIRLNEIILSMLDVQHYFHKILDKKNNILSQHIETHLKQFL